MTNKLFYIALVTSIAGLILLTYATDLLEPGVVKISKIDNSYLYKNVHVQGEVVDLKKFNSGSILLMVDDKTGIIMVFISYQSAEKVKVQEGQRVDVIGTLEIYNDELEIVVNDYKHITIV